MQPERVMPPRTGEKVLMFLSQFRGLWIVLLIGMIWLSSGCSAMKPQTTGEWAFHTANLVDTLQTINHGKDPCYVESNAFTASVLGEQPKAGETIAFMLGVSAIHRFISWEMQRNDVPMWVQNTFNGITFTTKAAVVVQNHNNGIRPWGNNDGSKVGCVR